MKKMIQIIKIHKLAFCFAFLTAIIISYPQIQFRFNESYQGIDMTLSDAEDFYQVRVQEVRDGHPSLANPYFREGKEEPYSQPPLAEILAAYLGKLFFLDLNNTILLTRVFFGFLLYLAIYGFIYLFFKEKLIAQAASASVFFGNMLLSRHLPDPEFLGFSRVLHPLVSSFFFFAFLSFFWLFLEQRKWYFGGLSALFLGLSFYILPYTWIFLYGFCGILILIFLFQKDWQKIKRIILVLLLSLLVATPYFINFHQMSIHPNYLEFQQRYGLTESRTPILGYLVPSLFVIFLLFFPRKCRKRYFFFLALVITPFIVLNQQLITGSILHPGHWHWYYHRPLAIIFLVVIFLNKLSEMKREKLKKAMAILIIGAGIYNGLMIQNASYTKYEESLVSEQRYAPILEWLNKNIQKEEVVLAAGLSRYIPIYTSLNVAYHSAAFHYLSVAPERLLDNEFLIYKLEGVKPEEAKEIFFRDRDQLSFKIKGLYFREKINIGSYQSIPDEFFLELVPKYQAFYAQPIEEYLRKYQVKYAIWDTEKEPQWALDQYQFLRKIYEKNGLKIFELL